MILPDVNVMIYAFDADRPRYNELRPWLEAVLHGDSPFGMSPQVLSSAVRILTNPRVFSNPHPLAKVLDYCNEVFSAPNCHVILPGLRHWQIFSDLCTQADAKGPLIYDAWFAALAIEHGCEWITLDRDFARFPKLRWTAPF